MKRNRVDFIHTTGSIEEIIKFHSVACPPPLSIINFQRNFETVRIENFYKSHIWLAVNNGTEGKMTNKNMWRSLMAIH